jgi:hypothetical protein
MRIIAIMVPAMIPMTSAVFSAASDVIRCSLSYGRGRGRGVGGGGGGTGGNSVVVVLVLLELVDELLEEDELLLLLLLLDEFPTPLDDIIDGGDELLGNSPI